jgi:hypothetical protein
MSDPIVPTSFQPPPMSQYNGPPPQNGPPPAPPTNPLPTSEPPPAAPTSSAPPPPNQGGGQASISPTGQGSAQANAQAAYAAQQLAMLQQNGYPFPFTPASLNLPPFPPFTGASGHLPGISPAAVSMCPGSLAMLNMLPFIVCEEPAFALRTGMFVTWQSVCPVQTTA